jgi:TetR/AcrR family transcriptional repressor of nem operon
LHQYVASLLPAAAPASASRSRPSPPAARRGRA